MPLREVKALFDFEAQDENELNFNVGDVIEVIDERKDGWIIGILNGLSGLVPANYVECVNNKDNTDKTGMADLTSKIALMS